MAGSTTIPERETFSQIGAHPAVDLMNTVDWRLAPQRRLERLTKYQYVVDWCAQMGLVDDEARTQLLAAAAADPATAARELRSVVALREAVYEAIQGGGDERERSLELIARAHRGALANSRLVATPRGFGWVSEQDLAAPRRLIVAEIIDLFTGGQLPLFHQCEDEACGWVYLDTSPRHNRRWCVAADCGNRNRVRAHYRRRRQAAT